MIASSRFGTAIYGGALYGVNPGWYPAAPGAVDWRLIAHLPDGTPIMGLPGARGVTVTFRLGEPSTLEFSLDGEDRAAGELVDMGTDVMAWRNGVRLLRTRLLAPADELTEDTVTTACQAVDYRGVLNRRILTAAGSWTGADQSEIAWDLIEAAQAEAGGHLGIARGGGQVTGRNRDRNYEAGKSVGEALTQLSEVIDGFDFDISPAMTFDVHYPQRGQHREFVAHYGVTVSALSRRPAPDEFANAVRFSGADSTTAVIEESTDLADRREGRWDRQQGDPDISVQTTVAEKAASLLADSEHIRPAYTATLRPGAWDGPATLWLGDTCRLVARAGRVDVDTTVRVQEIAVAVGDDGGEEVRVTFDRPTPSLLRRLAAQGSRLTDLERR